MDPACFPDVLQRSIGVEGTRPLHDPTRQPAGQSVHNEPGRHCTPGGPRGCREAARAKERLPRKPSRLPSPSSAARAVSLSGRPALLSTRMAVVIDAPATPADRQKAPTPTGADSRNCAPPIFRRSSGIVRYGLFLIGTDDRVSEKNSDSGLHIYCVTFATPAGVDFRVNRLPARRWGSE